MKPAPRPALSAKELLLRLAKKALTIPVWDDDGASHTCVSCKIGYVYNTKHPEWKPGANFNPPHKPNCLFMLAARALEKRIKDAKRKKT